MSPLSARTSSSTLRITDGEGGEIHYRKGYLQTVKLYYEISYQHVICMDSILLHSLNKTHYRISTCILRCGSSKCYLSVGFQQWMNMYHMHLVTFINIVLQYCTWREPSEHEHVHFGVAFKLLLCV